MDNDENHSVAVKITVLDRELHYKISYTEEEGLEKALERAKQRFVDEELKISVALPE